MAPPNVADDDAARAAAQAGLLANPLSEANAVQLAFLSSPRMQAEYAKLDLRAADWLAASRLRNPRLGAGALFPSGGGTARYDLGLTAGLAELLILPARRRFAASEFERAQLEATDALLDLAADTQRAYYTALAAQQALGVQAQATEAAAIADELSARYAAAGNLAPTQRAADRLAAAEAATALEAARTEAQASRSALANLMGQLPRTPWQLPSQSPPPQPAAPDSAPLLAQAERGNSAFAATRGEVSLAEENLRTTRNFRWLGEVDAGASFERDDDGKRLTGPTLAIELPLFDQGQATVLRATARRDAARAALTERMLALTHDIERGHAQLSTALARSARLESEVLPQQALLIEQTQRLVNYGLASPFELLRAKQAACAAELEAIAARRDAWHARIALERVVGSRLPDATPIQRSAPEQMPGQTPMPASVIEAPHVHHHSTAATQPEAKP